MDADTSNDHTAGDDDAQAVVLRVAGAAAGAEWILRPKHVLIAGYTGRDVESVRRHIAELAGIGIAPPAQVPTVYPMPCNVLTVAARIVVRGAQTSGEVEPVFIRHAGAWYLGVGSDHTDRILERVDIGRAKAACPKPISPDVVMLPDDLASGAGDAVWDDVLLTASVDGLPYQYGTAKALRPPSDLVPRVLSQGAQIAPDDDIVIFAGTLPLLTGEFRYGRRWELSLTVDGMELRHTYEAHVASPSEGAVP